MADRAAPQFVDEEFGVIAPSAPPVPHLDRERAEQRKRMFAPSFDLYLLVVVGVLCAIGLLMVYSASIDASFLATEDRTTTYFFERQLRNFFVGLIIMAIIARIDYRIWKRLSVWMMLATILVLISVLQFGDRRLEAQRALFQGSIQPGEGAKLVVVIYMAAWLASKRHKLKNVTYGIIPFSIMIGTVAFLIVLQPDLSTAASILATALTMFFLAGASTRQIVVIAIGAAIAGATIAVQLPYANDRISAHLDATRDLTQANDHVQAAIAAFLNGGMFGVGLGEGRQKFGALPFPHTDSVFAVIGEELGLLGCFIVIALYVMLVYRGFVVSRNAPDAFGSLLAAGITCWLVYDAMLNIAVMTALVPPTGVPLPFISFGGSSLVAAMAGVGYMLSVSRVASQPMPVERQQYVAAEAVPVEEKRPKQVKPRRKTDDRKIRLGLQERRKRREQELAEIKARREDRKQIEETVAPRSLDDLPDDVLVEAGTPEETPPPQEGTEVDENPDLSRRDRRGRISRISCR